MARAEPPTALPGDAPIADLRFQPAFDYDTDGCYPTPAIGTDGTIAPGLNPTGALDGNCRDESDLRNTNSYSRSKCNNGWCAYMYALYFEKDQAVPGAGGPVTGHRHDIEHVVVWVSQATDSPHWVSVSCHGDYKTYAYSQAAWQGNHAKVVYHKDGPNTHCFRTARQSEEPENHDRTWQYPPLVGWDNFPPGFLDKLMTFDFGRASFDLRRGYFEPNLADAMPELPFDPYA
ncbi:NPP1 family protein [Lentzea sp. NPDC060358]|uniref:NPP1 family protein n=1 Tax=Lentzea sp. NPDC060358 TaxID=3347103 RepID=UPI0036574A50